MKKLFYTLALLFVIALSISACTKEVVNPLSGSNGGGGVSAEKGS